MIVKKVTAAAFGRLKEWESPQFSSKLTVFYGGNETGKSTLFNLVMTLLYGWKPVKDNEYIPWDGKIPIIKGTLVTEDGQELEVTRRLRSQPEGILSLGERNITLRNDAIPQVAFMSREVFQEIYALGLDQLRFPDQSAWQKLQDQLLGGQYGSFLRPVSEVLNDLVNDVGNLWRSDRRGSPRSKVLNQEINELKQKIREAEENEQALRDLEKELDQLNVLREQLKEDKIRITTLQRRYNILIPLRGQLQRLQELKTDAGNIDSFDSLPAQPDQVMNQSQEEIQALEGNKDALHEKIEQAELVEDAFSEYDRKVTALSGVIRPLIRRSGQLQNYIDQQRELQQKRDVNYRRLQDRVGQFVIGGWRPELFETVNTVDEVELKAAVDSFSSFNQKKSEAAAQLEGLKSISGAGRGFRLSRKAPLVALLMLFVGIAGSLVGGISPLGIGSAVMGAAGIILLAFWYLSSSREQEDDSTIKVEQMQEKLSTLEEKCRLFRQQVQDALQSLPVAKQRLDTPDGSLIMDIKDLKILLREQEDIQQGIKTVEKHLADAAAALEEPTRICDLQPGLDLIEIIELLDQRLTAAEERRQQAANAEKDKNEALTELKEVDEKLKLAKEKLEQLEEILDGLPGENREEKLEALICRRKVRQQAETLENELYHQHQGLDSLKEEIEKAEAAGDNWIYSDETEVRVQLELEETDEKLDQASSRIGTLQNELSSKQQKERLDDLQGQLSCLQEELAEVTRERDRLLLLHNLLTSADKKFREEHQPDVLQKAGRYLTAITGGRYTRLSVKEDGSRLELQSDYYDYPIEAKHPLSRGTLEQVYLALRLALVEHLDAGGERLPLFLDEALVNWDGSRLGKGLQLLEELSATRQVFLFTCHEWLAESLKDRNQIITI